MARFRKVSIGSHGYAQVFVGGKVRTMHSVILGTRPDGMIVDHINRNRLDNRKANLRWVTPFENNMNMQRSNAYPTRSGRWQAKVKCHGVQHYLGTFDTRQQAEAVSAAWWQTNGVAVPTP